MTIRQSPIIALIGLETHRLLKSGSHCRLVGVWRMAADGHSIAANQRPATH
jgi:hypothetical protein